MRYGVFLFLSLFLLVRSQAAVLTGNLGLITGNAAPGQKVSFTPPGPSLSGSTLTLPRSTTVTSDANGIFTVTLIPGDYTMAVEGLRVLFIKVPADVDVMTLNTPSQVQAAFLTSTNQLWRVKADGSDTNALTLSEKLVAGSNVTLDVVDGTGTNRQVRITASGSGGGSGTGNAILTNGAPSRLVVTDANTNLTVSATTATEAGYVHGVTSAIQSQLAGKANLASGSQASRLAITDSSTNLTTATTTSTEATYLHGVSGPLQPQLDNKAAASHQHNATTAFNAGTVPSNYLPFNSATGAGMVSSGTGQANKTWQTDVNGNPAWRDPAANTNTPSYDQINTGTLTIISNAVIAYATPNTITMFGTASNLVSAGTADIQAGLGQVYQGTNAVLTTFAGLGAGTSGDVIYRGASAWSKLAKGSDGQVLTLASGLPSWAAAAGGGGGSFVGAVSNNVASAGLLAVDSTKTNGIAATTAHVQAALGQVYQATNANLTSWSSLAPSAKQDTMINSAGLAAALSDETGSGPNVFANGATLGSFTVTTNIYKTRSAASWSGTANLDFAGDGALWPTLGGSVVISSANLAAGRTIDFTVDNTTATNCNVILPSGWRFLSGTVTNILASGKIGQGRAESRAANDTNVLCRWISE